MSEMLGITHLPAHEQEAVRMKVGEVILAKIIAGVSEQLSAEDRAALDSLKSWEEVQQFLMERVPNLETYAQEQAERTITEFREVQKTAE